MAQDHVPATPDAAGTPSDDTHYAVIERMCAVGATLIPMGAGTKKQPPAGFPSHPGLSATAAYAHQKAGGNLAAVMGIKSRMIAIDCEDQLATNAVMTGGIVPLILPAKSLYNHDTLAIVEGDEDSGKPNTKRGGSHTWLRVPDDIDPNTLPHSGTIGIRLQNGGIVDVLAAGRYAMAPLSKLAVAPGSQYAVIGGTQLDPSVGLTGLQVAPMWLFDREVACPEGLEALRGILAPLTPRERVERDARSVELTNQIDEIGLDEWIAGDHRILLTGQVDGCGCEIAHFQGASSEKSMTLHDGCGHGYGIHIWSGTMIGELNLNGHHLSRLDLACALRGQSRQEVARSHGIQLGEERQELGILTPEDYERMAKQFEIEGDSRRAAMYRQAAETLRATQPTFEQRGEFNSTARVFGAPIAPIPYPTPTVNGTSAEQPQAAPLIGGIPHIGGPPGSAGQPDPDNVVPIRPGVVPPTAAPAPDPDPVMTPEEKAAAEAEAAAEALADKRDPYRHLPDPCSVDLEEKVFGDPRLPQVGQIRTVARAAAMSPWSTLGLSIGRGLLRVRSHVMFPPLVGGTPAPLNFQLGIVGASGRGKGAAHGLVTFDARWEGTLATEESIDKKFMPPSGAALAGLFVAREKDDDGNVEVVPIREAAWCDWSEVDTLTAQSGRGGNDLASELRASITGAELGTDPKKDGADPIKVDALSYRILVSFSTQYGKPAAGLLAEKDGGTLQRTAWFSTTDPRSLTKRPRGVTPTVDLTIMRDLPDSHTQTHPDGDRAILTVDEDIWDIVWEAQAAKIRHDRDVDELGGHENLTRLRIAAWAALTRHQPHIGAFEWEWAGYVMEHSRRVRARLEASVNGLKKAQAVENGQLDFDRKNAAEVAKVAHTEKLLAALAKWGRDVREGRNAFGKSGPTFTLRDIQASAKSRSSERYKRASELAAELCQRDLWVLEGGVMRSVEADPE